MVSRSVSAASRAPFTSSLIGLASRLTIGKVVGWCGIAVKCFRHARDDIDSGVTRTITFFLRLMESLSSKDRDVILHSGNLEFRGLTILLCHV